MRETKQSGLPGLTPLMQQYRDIKSKHPGVLLFFRLGDFYEMFGDDAINASNILDIVLTKRQGIPMCGVPHHSVNSYLRKIIKAGEKVAVCEQLEEPGQGRGIVKRDVVRVITPGTVLEDNLLNSKQNNYLMALCPSRDFKIFGVSYVDVSTGEFTASELPAEALKNEIYKVSPGEIIVPDNYAEDDLIVSITKNNQITLSCLESYLFSINEAQVKIKEFYKTISLKPFGIENRELAACACGGILAYLSRTQLTE